jgi:phosphoenolpyruvate synthase/pyruvate phosphate dikinase
MTDTIGSVTPITEADDLTRYGTKAQSLAQLAAAGFPVPEAFCIPADAYREHADRAGLKSLIAILRAVPADAPAISLTPILQRIRSSIIHTPLDPGLVAAVRAGYDAFGDVPVSVRSSITVPDLVTGPLVGRHGTYFTPGFDETLHAITHCWTSLWGDLSWRDRDAAGLADVDVAIAVVIQKLVAASSSGVVFTADPQTGDRDTVVVESCYGLAEAIVAGKVKPDRFVLAREGLAVLQSDVHPKAVRLLLDEGGRVVQRVVPPDLSHAASITPYEVREIAALALNIEHVVGSAACVEWARAGGTTWLLQARPLSVGR